jgi:hypothetical protein
MYNPSDFHHLGKEKSVGGVYWNDLDKIIEKTEEILLNSFYITEETVQESTKVPSSIQSLAAELLISHLHDKKYFKSDNPQIIGSAEGVVLRALNFYRNYDFSEITDEAGRINEVRQLEFIQEYLMYISMPPNYNLSLENWNRQKPFHDQKLLDEWTTAANRDEEHEEEAGPDLEVVPAIEDVKDSKYYERVDVDSYVPLLEKILPALHDRHLGWKHKGVHAYLMFHQYSDSELDSHSKEDVAQINKIRREIAAHQPASTYECDCETEQLIRDDIDVLQPSVRFLLENNKITFNAKAILLYMLLHRYRYCEKEEFFTKDLRAGLTDLKKNNYIREVRPGTFYVFDDFYKDVRRGLGIPYLERPYQLHRHAEG